MGMENMEVPFEHSPKKWTIHLGFFIFGQKVSFVSKFCIEIKSRKTWPQMGPIEFGRKNTQGVGGIHPTPTRNRVKPPTLLNIREVYKGSWITKTLNIVDEPLKMIKLISE